MQSIKETKEAILGVVALGVYITKRAKDGFDVNDATDFVQKLLVDAEFKAKLTEAVDGIDKVPEEIKNISFVQVLELASILPEVVNMLSEK